MFLIQVPKKDSVETTRFLQEKAQEFSKSTVSSVAIDLSLVSVLLSNELGQIALLIKMSRGKKGKCVIFAPHSTIADTLDVVNFDQISDIVRDKDEFQSRCDEPDSSETNNQTSSAQTDRGPDKKRTAPETNRVKNQTIKSDETSKQPTQTRLFSKNGIQLVMYICFTILVLLTGGLSILSWNQYNSLNVLMKNSTIRERQVQIQSDSLMQQLKQCQEEYKIYMDLDNNHE